VSNAMPTGRPNRAATALINLCVPESRSVPRRVVAKAAQQARRIVTTTADPLVERRVGGRQILLPLSHELPHFLAAYPHYGQNLVHLVDAVARAKGPRGFVDIGANVGDTIILVRTRSNVPALAIEGDELYGPLLAANLADVHDVEIELSYVASTLSAGRVQAARKIGTAALLPSDSPSALALRPLTEIIAAHPRFRDAGVVKIDTDGADAAIVVANADWFAEARPVVFFEYDSTWAAKLGDREPWRAFGALAGYGKAIVYVNTGELLLEASVQDETLWRDLARYATSPTRGHYFDVAVFPEEDEGLFRQFLERERARFEAASTPA
jgi:FkbM family methyltransferase